jgi:hypothetical protein
MIVTFVLDGFGVEVLAGCMHVDLIIKEVQNETESIVE